MNFALENKHWGNLKNSINRGNAEQGIPEAGIVFKVLIIIFRVSVVSRFRAYAF